MIHVTPQQQKAARNANAKNRRKADPAQEAAADTLSASLAVILGSEGIQNYSPSALERYIQDVLPRAFARRECPGKLVANELIKHALESVDYVDLAVRLRSDARIA